MTHDPPGDSKETLAVVAAFAILCLIWSSTWLVIKIGLQDLPPISYVAIRFIIAILLLLGASVGRVGLIPKTRRDVALLAFTGALLFGVNYCLLFWAELHVSSGLAAVLQATIPVFGIVLAHWLLPDEPLRWPRLAGSLVAVGGVALICSRLLDLRGPMAFWGALAILLGSFAAALSNTLMKRYRVSLAPSMIAAWQMIFAVLPLVVIGYALEGNPLAFSWTTRAILCVLYLAVVGSAIAFWLFYWLLARMAATNIQTISLIIPPVALLIGWGAGGESFSRGSMIGTGLVLVGVWTVFRRAPGSGGAGMDSRRWARIHSPGGTSLPGSPGPRGRP